MLIVLNLRVAYGKRMQIVPSRSNILKCQRLISKCHRMLSCLKRIQSLPNVPLTRISAHVPIVINRKLAAIYVAR